MTFHFATCFFSLGVYPQGLDGRRRLDYMRNKSLEYNKLKTAWLDIIGK